MVASLGDLIFLVNRGQVSSSHMSAMIDQSPDMGSFEHGEKRDVSSYRVTEEELSSDQRKIEGRVMSSTCSNLKFYY